MLKHSIVTHQSPIPFRWIVNYFGEIGSNFLVKAMYLDEDNNYGFKYRLYSKVWKFTDFFSSRWGTYYNLHIDALKEDMSGPEWDDYDSDGYHYWEYDWQEDPVTGDAWRLKKKNIFETQVDFE